MASGSTIDENIFEDSSRPLDKIETVHHAVHEVFPTVGMFGNLLVFRSKEVVTEATMKKAVQLATVRNPLLGSKLNKDDQGVFMLTPIEPDAIEFDVYDGEDWDVVLNSKTYEPFLENSSQIKAVFLPNIRWNYHKDDSGFEDYQHISGLYVLFNHILSDDNGSNRFAGNVLTYLDEILTNRDFSLKKMAMLPGVYHYLEEKFRPTLPDKVIAKLYSYESIRKRLLPIYSIPNPYITKFGSELKRNPNMEHESVFVPIEIGPRELDTVIRKCKENGTTVNGAIQTAYLQAFATIMNDMTFERAITIPHVDNMDLRRWSFPENNIPAEYCMNAASQVPLLTKVRPINSEEQFWKMARNMTKKTHKEIHKGRVFSFYKLLFKLGLIKVITHSMPFDPSDPTFRRRDCLHTSNAGRCDFLNMANTSAVKMRSKFGVVATRDKFGVIFQNYIYTFEGRLFWSVTYDKHVVKPEHAEQYVRLVRNWFVKQSPD